MSKVDDILKDELDPKDPDPTPRGGKRRDSKGIRFVQRLGELAGFGGIAAVTLVAALAGLVGCKPVDAPSKPTPTTVQCDEDQPCFDCHTMGNRRCGPDDPAVKQ